MGIAEHALAEELGVLRDVRFGIEAGASVVEVRMAAGVQAGIVRGAQLVEHGGARILREVTEESLIGASERLRVVQSRLVCGPPGAALCQTSGGRRASQGNFSQ